MFCNVAHTFAVCTVGTDQQYIVFADDAGQYGFYTECAAALHKNSGVFRFGNMCQFQQFFTDGAGDFLIVFIPCAVVVHHLLFYGCGCGQRAGCQ